MLENINIITGNNLANIIDKDILIFDCRPFDKYVESHIPGAVNQDLMHFHWFDTSKEGLLQFEFQLKKLLSFWGVMNKKVIFYDDVSGPSSARGLWLLNYLSHTDVYILDGGFNEWISQGYKIEQKSNPFQPALFEASNVNNKIIADYSYILSKLNDDSCIILDVRSYDEYIGRIVRAARVGHILKAINIDWKNNIDKNKFKSLDVLKTLYDLPKDKEIITYCQGGYRAANTFAVLKRLGYKHVRMYLGSWGEWGNMNNLPIE